MYEVLVTHKVARIFLFRFMDRARSVSRSQTGPCLTPTSRGRPHRSRRHLATARKIDARVDLIVGPSERYQNRGDPKHGRLRKTV
ncbi:hypothetical protein SAMN05216276_10205 [Streptosporangium subroseum]|uniref:Uncharacterized protein n=1 Tax=Streptosporangium subroseum TaxID=106412 RepID=A0A239IKB9_9ACTN|nr:hypothetical protein SAMN05216276_10205 [Streptosporangium subroseum]